MATGLLNGGESGSKGRERRGADREVVSGWAGSRYNELLSGSERTEDEVEEAYE